jgi:hypothetical protein
MVSTYITNLTNNKIIVLFVCVFIVLYLYVFMQNDSASNFFIISMIIVGFLINNHSKTDKVAQKNELNQYITNIEKTVISHSTPQMVLETVYRIHKPLKSLRFIKNNKEATQIVYYLRFLKIYDNEGYLDIIVYLEHFLKLHFNIMIDKYDVQTNFIILKDIRREILNALQASCYNIPNISKVFDSKDLDERMKNAISKVQALTYRYVKIIYKKYHHILRHENYKGTIDYDTMKNNHYHMY